MSTFKDILTCIAQGLTTFCYVWDTHILCAYLFFGKRITQYFSPAFIQGYDKFKALSLSLIKFMQIMIWCCSIHVVKIIINRHSHTHKYVDVDTDTHTHTHVHNHKWKVWSGSSFCDPYTTEQKNENNNKINMDTESPVPFLYGEAWTIAGIGWNVKKMDCSHQMSKAD